MLREQVAQQIAEICARHNKTHKDFASIINKDVRTAQNRFILKNWTFEDIEAIEKEFNEKILYSAKEIVATEEVKAIIQIELKNRQKEFILQQLIGKKDLEILKR